MYLTVALLGPTQIVIIEAVACINVLPKPYQGRSMQVYDQHNGHALDARNHGRNSPNMLGA